MKNGYLSLQDMSDISVFLNENGYSNDNMTIIIDVTDKEMLNRLNYDFYYRNKGSLGGDNELEENVDEINFDISGVKFKYKIKNNQF